ncbi:Glycosyl transferase, family 4, conserved region [Paenibacillus curdlanolyticus YK9]|uniref:Glycosyl transferase, family 4, conserved region n=1 Tax=Paenibacillus curdlanolyticus YK9 TaxID=717606 RepID=E0IDC8_9BACL|nr:MraY family glycosyltransferase [Paenibacillus curdlanolyticus]EFM09583.1 Glycosyl transferase, family 4, conserved region [Paenibacillus curdlanolyticus YK9]
MRFLAASLISFALMFAFVPLFRKVALRIGFVDRPNTRKIHRKPIPLMGGAAIYIATIVSLLAFVGVTKMSLCIITGGIILVVVGMVDDYAKSKGEDFPVMPRVIAYLVVATLPLWFGIRIDGVSNLGEGGMLLFPDWLSWSSTIIWVFALINMINFIDGVDGLASGISTLSAFTLFLTALIKGQSDTALLAVILGGSCIGFLVFNFHPARIFMGDAGATFIGYSLAVIAVGGAFKSATFLTMIVPLLALGMPIMDTVIVMLRRLMTGKGLHQADKLHSHHLLMRWGLNQIQTVSFLYLIAAVFCLLSILLLIWTG